MYWNNNIHGIMQQQPLFIFIGIVILLINNNIITVIGKKTSFINQANPYCRICQSVYNNMASDYKGNLCYNSLYFVKRYMLGWSVHGP